MMFDIQSGKPVFCEKADPTLAIGEAFSDGGLITVDQKGRVCRSFVDENNLLSYIMSVKNDLELGNHLRSLFYSFTLLFLDFSVIYLFYLFIYLFIYVCIYLFYYVLLIYLFS